MTRFRDRQIWRTGSGNSAILAPKSSDQENREKNPYLWNKSRLQFSYAARCFMPKIVVYQTAPVWFVKNECFMAKIDVYRSLLASDRVIGWVIKMTSHPNSNANFINIWDRLIWRRSPNLTRSSKLAAAPNWWPCDSAWGPSAFSFMGVQLSGGFTWHPVSGFLEVIWGLPELVPARHGLYCWGHVNTGSSGGRTTRRGSRASSPTSIAYTICMQPLLRRS